MVTFLSCKLEDTHKTCTAHFEQGDSESLSLESPFSGVPLAICMRNLLLQTNINACCQKFMMGSLAGVLFTIPKVGGKSSGLGRGQILVFLVDACRLLRTCCARLLGLRIRLLPTHPHVADNPRARSFAHQKILWCSNSRWHEFVCACLAIQHIQCASSDPAINPLPLGMFNC